MTGSHPDLPQRIRIPPPQSSQGEMNHGDGSWPLYAMYSNIAQEEDSKVAQHNQQAADGILIFVSPHITSLLLHTSLGRHSLVYSPPLLPHCLR